MGIEDRLLARGWRPVGDKWSGQIKYWVKGDTVCRVAYGWVDCPVRFIRHAVCWIDVFTGTFLCVRGGG
jgi:hypothetical protein